MLGNVPGPTIRWIRGRPRFEASAGKAAATCACARRSSSAWAALAPSTVPAAASAVSFRKRRRLAGFLMAYLLVIFDEIDCQLAPDLAHTNSARQLMSERGEPRTAGDANVRVGANRMRPSIYRPQCLRKRSRTAGAAALKAVVI